MQIRKPDTNIKVDLSSFLTERKSTGLTVICGSNNSGKSFLLKKMCELLGSDSYFLAVQRFYNATEFASSQDEDNRKSNTFTNFVGQFRDQSQNTENNQIDLPRLITDLSNNNREKLFKIASLLLGQQVSFKRVNPDNDLSKHYIEVNGTNMSFASAGTRLLITLLGTLVNPEYNTYLLDEPELGLTPRIQNQLVQFLYNSENRKEYFPHIENLIVATHSHLFLDKSNLGNNFVIETQNNVIEINQVNSISKLHELQFNLLGNTFESLFLPSLIVLVEGKTDHEFISKVIESRFPDHRVAVIHTNNDTAIKEELFRLQRLLFDISTSPYKDRILVVVDKVLSSPSLIPDIEKLKIPHINIIRWEHNGIEYYYPIECIKSLFSCDDSQANQMSIVDDRVTINGITKTKAELCKLVVAMINNKVTYNQEFMDKLLSNISRILS